MKKPEQHYEFNGEIEGLDLPEYGIARLRFYVATDDAAVLSLEVDTERKARCFIVKWATNVSGLDSDYDRVGEFSVPVAYRAEGITVCDWYQMDRRLDRKAREFVRNLALARLTALGVQVKA